MLVKSLNEKFRGKPPGVRLTAKAEKALKGYAVIMDNASFHRKKELRKPARRTARLLFLSPYSPDYNPIEKDRPDMKRFLRNNMKDFQSLDSAIYIYFDVPDN